VHDPQAALSRLLIRTTGGTSTYYVYAAGMLLYEESGTATRTYHYDYRGSTVAITGDAQEVTDRIFYAPYGEIVARTAPTASPTDTPFLHHGAHGIETDGNGLRLMRARYYNPETRRFQNADPIGFEAGLNWYAFVSGEPVNLVDPIGESPAWADLRSLPSYNPTPRPPPTTLVEAAQRLVGSSSYTVTTPFTSPRWWGIQNATSLLVTSSLQYLICRGL
jgi:RHS repeat-associated protein